MVQKTNFGHFGIEEREEKKKKTYTAQTTKTEKKSGERVHTY